MLTALTLQSFSDEFVKIAVSVDWIKKKIMGSKASPKRIYRFLSKSTPEGGMIENIRKMRLLNPKEHVKHMYKREIAHAAALGILPKGPVKSKHLTEAPKRIKEVAELAKKHNVDLSKLHRKTPDTIPEMVAPPTPSPTPSTTPTPSPQSSSTSASKPKTTGGIKGKHIAIGGGVLGALGVGGALYHHHQKKKLKQLEQSNQ